VAEAAAGEGQGVHPQVAVGLLRGRRPEKPTRNDVGFLERVAERRRVERYESVDELNTYRRAVRHRGTGRCPVCGRSMPVSTGAKVCGRKHEK
jgi:hypothetical protein